MWSNDTEKQVIFRTLAEIEAGNMTLPRALIDALNAYTATCFPTATSREKPIHFDASGLGSDDEIKAHVRKTAEDTARKELAALNTIRIGITENVPRTAATEMFMNDKIAPWMTYRRVRTRIETFTAVDLAQAKRDFYNRLIALRIETAGASASAHRLANDERLSTHAKFFAQLIACDHIRRARELMIMKPALEQPELMSLVHELISVREVIAGILPLD